MSSHSYSILVKLRTSSGFVKRERLCSARTEHSCARVLLAQCERNVLLHEPVMLLRNRQSSCAKRRSFGASPSRTIRPEILLRKPVARSPSATSARPKCRPKCLPNGLKCGLKCLLRAKVPAEQRTRTAPARRAARRAIRSARFSPESHPFRSISPIPGGHIYEAQISNRLGED
jgi:hypothetical protein